MKLFNIIKEWKSGCSHLMFSWQLRIKLQGQRNWRAGVRTFTLLELLVVAAIIAILTSLIFPALKTARQTSKKIACTSNLREFGKAIAMYSCDQNGYSPASTTSYRFWDYLLSPYLNYDYNKLTTDSFTVFHCPGANKNTTYMPYRSRGYSINDYLTRPDYYGSKSTSNIATCKTPSLTICMGDTAYNANMANSYEGFTSMTSIGNCAIINPGFDAFNIDYRHSTGVNVLFMDSHVSLCNRGQTNSYGYFIPRGTRWLNNGTMF